MEKDCECYEEEVQPYRKTDYNPIIYIPSTLRKRLDNLYKITMSSIIINMVVALF